MKTLKLLIFLLIGGLFKPALATNNFNQADSLNPLAVFSLFYEYYRNGDLKSAYPFGWQVIQTAPTKFLKYNPYKKMDKCIWFMHDSVATTEEEKQKIADTSLVFYDLAAKYDISRSGYFTAKKAFVLRKWFDVNP